MIIGSAWERKGIACSCGDEWEQAQVVPLALGSRQHEDIGFRNPRRNKDGDRRSEG